MSRAKTVEINKENVKTLLDGKGMTVKDLAGAIGTNYSYLCKALKLGKVSVKKRKQMADAIGCAPLDLAKDQTEMVVRRRGRWIFDAENEALVCDRCGCVMWVKGVTEGTFYFCTNCGADMRADE